MKPQALGTPSKPKQSPAQTLNALLTVKRKALMIPRFPTRILLRTPIISASTKMTLTHAKR